MLIFFNAIINSSCCVRLLSQQQFQKMHFFLSDCVLLHLLRKKTLHVRTHYIIIIRVKIIKSRVIEYGVNRATMYALPLFRAKVQW